MLCSCKAFKNENSDIMRPFITACLFIVLVSCNDDDPAPVQTDDALLTRISADGITELELFYDIHKNVYRLEHYSGGNLSSYTLYDYDEKGLKESRRYNAANHELAYRTVFTLDNFGRVIKAENYSPPDFGSLASVSEFSYNTSGQLVTREFSADLVSLYYRDVYTYDEGGNLVSKVRTLYPDQTDERKGSQYDYTPGSMSIPDHWKLAVFLLNVSDLDQNVRFMFNSNINVKAWNADEELYLEVGYEASDHELGNDGEVNRLVLTRKNILNPGNPDISYEMTYEYVE